MKPIIVFLFCSVSLIYCNNYHQKIKKNDLEKSNLKGKVHTVTELTYCPADSLSLKLIEKTITIYNPEGNITEYKDSMNGFFEHSKTFYDTQGRKSATNSFDSNNTTDRKTIYKYDKNYNPIELDRYTTRGGLEMKYISKFDDDNNKVEAAYINPNDSIVASFTFKYDNEGNETEAAYYASGHVLQRKSTKLYDDKGNITELDIFSARNNGTMKTITKYNEFDETGNWVKKSDFVNRGFVGYTIRKIEYYP